MGRTLLGPFGKYGFFLFLFNVKLVISTHPAWCPEFDCYQYSDVRAKRSSRFTRIERCVIQEGRI